MKTVRIAAFTGAAFLMTMCSTPKEPKKNLSLLDGRANQIRTYASEKGYSTQYCFLLDMRLQSGLKRFFVYDLAKNSVAFSGLVAHGSCDQNFIAEPRFSNTPGGGCTSVGIYKVGRSYNGNYGKAYKLYGLEKSNSNAFSRAIVLHGLSCVPDEEIYPKPLCNSSGCPMVSFAFLKQLSSIIDRADKPVLLWVYDVS